MNPLPREYEQQIAKKRIPGLVSAIAAAENRAATLSEEKGRAEAARARNLRALMAQLLADLGEEEPRSIPMAARRRSTAGPAQVAAPLPPPAPPSSPAPSSAAAPAPSSAAAIPTTLPTDQALTSAPSPPLPVPPAAPAVGTASVQFPEAAPTHPMGQHPTPNAVTSPQKIRRSAS